jgi:hypothetical protein
MIISAYDRVRIAAKIVAHPRTVQRVYDGAGSEYSRRRVSEAAKEMGLPLPLDPSERLQPSSPPESPPTSKAA